jgi:predicted permease
MSRFGIANRFEIHGRPEERIDDQKFSWVGIVGGRYFEAMGIPLLRGRFPGDADTEATEPVFVIDEALAQRYWPDTDPVGTRLTWPSESRTLSGPIIGVVRSVRWEAMSADPPASAYWWFPHAPGREFTVVARTDGDSTAIAGLLAVTVREIDPNQPVAEIRTMEDVVSADLARPRFTMILLGSFAAAALLLAAIGLYGVIAFAVAQRTREIGIRCALGAQPADVFRMVLQRGLMLVAAGLAIGVMASLALGRVVAGLLYEVSPQDPLTLLSVAALLSGISIAAMCPPARRATRIDPLAAIRTE